MPTSNTKPDQPGKAGGGAYVLRQYGPHLTPRQRQRIQTQIQDNVEQLGLDYGTILRSPGRVALSWPLQPAAGLDDYGYYGLSSLVDHNAAYPDQLLDYYCGTRTYDTASGYNHKGTDFFTWPFSWNKMDRDEVQVVAAAEGVIVYKEDGHFDRNCAWGEEDANVVAVLHGDGSTAWYVHLKKWSLTARPIGTSVTRGEYLGIVGSSGNSSGPHLHLEIHDWTGNLIDPYQGACNSLNAESWWETQRPYYEPAVNKLTTGTAPPELPDCEPETSYEKAVFVPGDTIYFTVYYRDQLADLPSQCAIYRPNGTVYDSWTQSASEEHYAASYWYWSYTFDTQVPTGTWRFEVTFDGQVYEHSFKVLELSYHLYLPVVKRHWEG